MIIAAIDQDAAQLTTGNLIAGLMLLGMVGVSLLALIFWGQKLATGQPLIPRVATTGILVRSPVTLFVLFVALMFCSLGIAASLFPSVPAGADAPLAENDGGSGEGNGMAEQDGANTALADEKPPDQQQAQPELNENLGLIIANIVIQMVIFLIIGGAIVLSNLVSGNAARNTRLTASGDPASNQHGEIIGHLADVGPPVTPANPYAVSAATDDPIAYFDQVLAGKITPRDSHNPYDMETNSREFEGPEPEGEAGFRGDFRYALEAVLVAFLPVFIIRMITSAAVGDLEEHPFLEMLKSDGGGLLIAAILIGGVVVAPISEELMYRVVLCGGLSRLISSKAAIIFSSVLFCVAHGLQDAAGLMPLALVLGYAYQQRKSYACVVMIHMMFNGFSMTAALVSLIGS